MLNYTKNGIVERKLRELEKNIYTDYVHIPKWRTKTGIYEDFGKYSEVEKHESEIGIGEHWICKDHLTRWFRANVEVPEEFVGKKAVLLLEFGGEGLVRINGREISALTSYLNVRPSTRTRVDISSVIHETRKLEIDVECGMNYMEFASFRRQGKTEIEYTFKEAGMALVDEAVEKYYFDLKTAFEALKTLENPAARIQESSLFLSETANDMEKLLKLQDPYVYLKVKNAIAESVTLLEFNLSREELVRSIEAAGKKLEEELGNIPHSPHALIKFVGQGHIDTAWLWTLRETLRKTAKTFSNVLSLMDAYPEFIFAFSQPQLFEYMKEYFPDMYQRIKEKVGNGQLELVGNTWVEMDANLPSGESLIRQILYGKQFFEKEFGKSSDVFWMPDVFGYSWALPQIIKKSGMKYFFTSKLNNNSTNKFPYSLFRWKGIDGTVIPAYLQRLNYNGDFCPQTVETIYNRFEQKDCCDEILMTFGYGDGGGGPSYQMLETGRRLKEFPGLQNTEIATAQSYFEDIMRYEPELPEWNDEMYFEHHRGTYTSQADMKKANRKNEFLYRNTEILCSIAEALWGCTYPYEKLLEGCKRMLTNQFHDILPGSSIAAVYQQAKKDNQEIKAIAQSEYEKAVDNWVENIPHRKGDFLIINTLPWKVSGMAKACNQDKIIERWVEEVPAFGYKLISKEECEVPGRLEENRIIHDESNMENDFMKIQLDSHGNIASIWDKEAEREVLEDGKRSNLLRIFEDKPANETAWNIELEYQNKYWNLDKLEEAKIIENTADRGILRQVRAFGNSRFVQDIIVYKHSRRIDFRTEVNWQEREKMLKAEFNVDILAGHAAYEIQFGAIERPNHWNTARDKARFEVCGHKWADLSEADYGVALMNDCKYGYDIKGKCMRLTLLRAAVDPDPEADKGSHEFTYSLYPHLHGWQQGNVVLAGYELNSPLHAVCCEKDKDAGNRISEQGFLNTDADNVVIDTVKKAENGDGWIIRVYESIGKKTNVNLNCNLPAEIVEECNLMEETERSLKSTDKKVRFTINPYEIKTFRMKRKDGGADNE